MLSTAATYLKIFYQETKITINQLEEEVSEKKLKMLNLEKENKSLCHLLNKYREGKDTSKTSDDFQNEQVSITVITTVRSYTLLF